uniref:Uncharacterized protein n=1 Tax=Anopheles farauti TaxID=69004 RepID=A0A182QVC6_9DIPT
MIWTRNSPLIETFGVELYVGHHLYYRPKSYHCYSQCLAKDQNDMHMEAARLKDILERKIEQCVGFQVSEHLLFPLENADKIVADPVLYVQYRLWQVEALRPLVDNVVTVYLAQNGVGFRMKTLIDKLKVLDLGMGQLNVIDYFTSDVDSTGEEDITRQ